jgi:hypothetical protein
MIVMLVLSCYSFSQEVEKISPYNTLQYFKNTDNQSSLQTTLTYSKNRMEIPIPGIEISFYTGGTRKELLGKVVTDENGVARVPVEDVSKLPADKDGMWLFVSEYIGSDTIEASAAELSVKDAELEMSLTVVDSIRTITLNATTSQKGQKIPVSGEVVMIYVPRMFSLLPIAEATLDENGAASVEFPSDLPGDKDGNLKIIARIEENPTYGNVEKTTIRNWGIPNSYSVPKTHRALWTKTPPMWMIITLSILLSGVWGHYLFAVISLILIKIDAKKQKVT